MNSKLLGGILLVVGTTIGAGMLALPVATAQLGFFGSLILLVSCWFVMTLCAFLFLEVNLWLPANTNLVSMAGATLGRPGQIVAWIAYLLLLYSILSAYIAGGSDIFHYLLASSGIDLPLPLAVISFTVCFGTIVYFGIRMVDYVNRGLMFGKMGAYLLLVLFIFPFITSENLFSGDMQHIFSANSITVTVVSFTCLMIIPSLRTYFGEDTQSLKKAIFYGTLIPLVCYIAWDLAIMGVIPIEGTLGLKRLFHAADSSSGIIASLAQILNKANVTLLAKFFTSICMVTAFLSVSLCLSDFLADGLQVAKRGMGKVLIAAITFIPPVVMVLYYPDAFIRGIQYAGLCCFVLMILYPPLMVWRGRYHCALATGESYRVAGGKALLATLLVFAVIMIYFGVRAA